ncbi:MAG: tetratricopeptide repeat protein [Thermodesulfovibrionales bacterium]
MLNGTVLHILLIAAAACCLYAPSLPSAFVLDDMPVIADNSSLDAPSAYLPVIGEYSGKPRSFGYFTFSLNYRLHGLDVEGYRATNIAIHIGAALLVYVLVRISASAAGLRSPEERQGFDRAGFIAGMLFAVHPVQTQAVTYLSQRFASLATLLCLLSVVAYGHWRSQQTRGNENGFQRHGWYALSLISAFLAMKTKEIAFTLPLMIVLAEAIFFRGSRPPRVISLIPYILLMLVIPLSLMPGQGSGASAQALLPAETVRISRHDYLMTQARVLATYGRLLLLPVNQNLDYDFPVLGSLTIVSLSTVIAKLLLLGSGIYAVARPATGAAGPRFWPRLFGFGVFWFFLSLAVESSIFPIRDVIFEHRLYLPSAGFCLIVIAAIGQVETKSPHMKPLTSAAVSILLVLLSVLTVSRNLTWRNNETLWSDVVSKSPAKARPRNNLGLIYAETGRHEKALEEFRFAALQDPGLAEAQVNLGNELYSAGRLDEAAAAYERAARLAPGFAKVRYNLGNLYMRMGRRDDAVAAYKKALELKPDYEKAKKALEELSGENPER